MYLFFCFDVNLGLYNAFPIFHDANLSRNIGLNRGISLSMGRIFPIFCNFAHETNYLGER